MNYRYLTLFLLLTVFARLEPCTGLLLKAKDGSVVSGRTVEFDRNLQIKAAFIPRNVPFSGTTPLGKGLSYRSKYAATGIFCFDDPILMDGMNEKGLVVGAFYFPGYADYTPITSSNKKKALSPIDFTNWVLTQFATIEEVKEGIKNVIIVPTVYDQWGSSPPPMHYIVYDAFGNSIVIEPVDGTLVVYDNSIGTITNSPTFDWHLTNLNNYINLTPYNQNSLMLSGYPLQAFGQGSGMLGLPGDFTPPSRFVRASFFSTCAIRPQNSYPLVGQAFHLLNQFDIPYGSVRATAPSQTNYDTTSITTVKNPNNMRYYYKTYQGQAISYIDLSSMNFTQRNIQTMPVITNLMTINVTNQLE